MGESERPRQPTDDAELSFTDLLLAGLAQELTDLGLTAELRTTLYGSDGSQAPGSVKVFTQGQFGRIPRNIIFCGNGKFVVREVISGQSTAGKLEWELSDPDAVEKVLQYVKRRIWHWAQLELVFKDEPQWTTRSPTP